MSKSTDSFYFLEQWANKKARLYDHLSYLSHSLKAATNTGIGSRETAAPHATNPWAAVIYDPVQQYETKHCKSITTNLVPSRLVGSSRKHLVVVVMMIHYKPGIAHSCLILLHMVSSNFKGIDNKGKYSQQFGLCFSNNVYFRIIGNTLLLKSLFFFSLEKENCACSRSSSAIENLGENGKPVWQLLIGRAFFCATETLFLFD